MLSNPFVFIRHTGFLTFFLELAIIQFLFMRKFPKRRYFWLRLSGCSLAAIGFAFMPGFSVGKVGLAYFVVLAYVIASAAFCFKANVFNCVFYGLTAWAVQHLAWCIYLIVCMTVKMTAVVTGVVYFSVYAAAYSAVFFVFSYKRDNYIIHRERIMACVISAVVLFVTTILYDYAGNSVWLSAYAAILSLVILFVQFGLLSKDSLRRESEQLETEKAMLEGMLARQTKQQKLTGETVEIINRKCHDLKHQISLLRDARNADGEKYLDEIEKAVMVYGDIAKTGNYALDITLTEKCLLCDERNIKFTYIVDGDSLNIIQPVDVSALFGNILDNAIESVIDESEERRIIRLNVSVAQGYLRVHCENYCSREVVFEDGLPKSKRGETGYHGFGTKSIRYIVEKYGGNVEMQARDDMFNVNIIIPVK